MASYQYVDSSGNLQTTDAANPGAAIAGAPNIDPHSGVLGAPPTPAAAPAQPQAPASNAAASNPQPSSTAYQSYQPGADGQSSTSQFSNYLDTAISKLNSNSDLLNQRQLLIKQLYDTPLSQTELQTLPQPIQQAISSGDKSNIEMQLRLINDGISGRANTLNQSINYLTTAYNDSINQAETQKQDAQTIVENALNRSGSLAFANYPASVKRQLEQSAGYPAGYLDNVSPTINQTRYNAQYGAGGDSITIPSGTIASQTNNPLNIKFSTTTAGFGGTDSGVSAQDGGTFAQFTSPEAGLQAAEQLLTSPTYSGLTVDQAMRQWSNGGYGAEITDIPPTTTMSSLSPSDLDDLVGSMAQRESGTSVVAPDIQQIARGIETGLQPPTTTGLYGKSAAVKSQLEKDGFNLTQASTDWTATQKWLATANGSQQVRLKQAISSVTQGVSALKTLATQWNAGGFAPLNSANLKAALSGAYGQDAQDIAAKFQQQSTIIQDELGQTFMGGNSPTDKALGLAGQVFDTSWSAQTLNDALDNLNTNLGYRLNAINSTGPTGVDGQSAVPPGDSTGASGSSGGGDYNAYLQAIGQ